MSFNRRVLIFIFFVCISFYNFIYVIKGCEIKNGIDANQLLGDWRYIVEISRHPREVRCGHMIFKEKNDKFLGYKFSFHGLKFRNVSMDAEIIDNKLLLQFSRLNKKPLILTLPIVTCNGDRELALELPSHDHYFLFSRGTKVTRTLLRKYLAIKNEKGLKLQQMNNTNCENLKIIKKFKQL